jgi:hypothetical protein
MNVNSWAPDSMRFAYVTYEALPESPVSIATSFIERRILT